MNRIPRLAILLLCSLIVLLLLTSAFAADQYNEALFHGMKWRSIGPYRGGRVLAARAGNLFGSHRAGEEGSQD